MILILKYQIGNNLKSVTEKQFLVFFVGHIIDILVEIDKQYLASEYTVNYKFGSPADN